MGSWAGLLMGLAGPIARRVLVSLGLSMVTYAGVGVAVNGILDAVKGSLSGMGTDVMQLVALSGIFPALGIVAGAMVASLALQPLKRLIPDGA